MVPSTELHNLLSKWQLRTQSDSIKTFVQARNLRDKGQKTQADKVLQDKGLCYVENAWWTVSRTDIHQALSFDTLHSIFLGIWGKHIWPVIIEALGPENCYTFDQRASMVPGFPGLRIFTHHITETTFSDGNTFFSILQQVLPLIHDLIEPRYTPLLHLVRLVADISMHGRFRMATMSRIERGRQLVREYGTTLLVGYLQLTLLQL